jgi:predicted RNA-binding Zn ribbon-like protein
MDRLLVSFLNTAAERPDPFSSALGAAKWWAAVQPPIAGLAVTVKAKPRFDPALLAHLRALRDSLAAGDGARIRFTGSAARDAVLFPIVHAAAAFFGSDRAGRLKTCRLQPCSRYFLDETKNGSRRWCSLRCMERARAPRRRTIAG